MTDQEINEAVARKLGWKSPNHIEDDCHFCDETKDHHHLWGAVVGGQKTIIDPVPDYCHDIKAAWWIVEYCQTNGWVFNCYGLENQDAALNQNKWHVVFHKNIAISSISHGAATAPMAICMVFLKLS